MNHGGLYGRANVDNFPNVNDYRNIVVAEAMKVLGFVNRDSRGVLRVQKELKANENGEAVYDFSYQTAVMVTGRKSPRADRMIKEAIANGLLMENEEKRSQKGSQKQTGLSVSEEKQTQKQTQKQTHKQEQKQTQKQEQKQTQKQEQEKQTQKQEQKQTKKQEQKQTKKQGQKQGQKQTKYQLIAPIVEEVYKAIKMNRKQNTHGLQIILESVKPLSKEP